MKKTNFKPPQNKNDLTSLLSSLIQNKKVSIFIDSANLYFAANVAKLRIDYKQVYKWFSEKSQLSGLNYYTAFDPEDEKQEEFLTDLESTGYRIIKKPIKVYQDFTKGNMDIELAVDALMMKDLYDVLILISGDGDFTYLIQALENQGKTIIVLGIGGFTSYELHQVADNYFFLNRISQVWQTPRKSKDAKREYTEYIPGIGIEKKSMNKIDEKLSLETKPEVKVKNQKVKSKNDSQKINSTTQNSLISSSNELVSDTRASSGLKNLRFLTSQQATRYSDSNKNTEDTKTVKTINKHPPVKIKIQSKVKTTPKPLNRPDEPRIFLV